MGIIKVVPGFCFRLSNTPSDAVGPRHVWVVVSDPTNDAKGCVVLVNFTSWHECQDSSCILKVGDHPTITHDTVIYYKKARVTEASRIESGVKNGRLDQLAQCTPTVLQKIIEGAFRSDFFTEKYKKFLPQSI